jgi:hypothetical protein
MMKKMIMLGMMENLMIVMILMIMMKATRMKESNDEIKH